MKKQTKDARAEQIVPFKGDRERLDEWATLLGFQSRTDFARTIWRMMLDQLDQVRSGIEVAHRASEQLKSHALQHAAAALLATSVAFDSGDSESAIIAQVDDLTVEGTSE